jgi:hypothetical protein
VIPKYYAGYNTEKMIKTFVCGDGVVSDPCLYAFLELVGVDSANVIEQVTYREEEVGI